MTWCFIKLFEKEEYADAFLAGALYLNPLKFFRDLERDSSDGRADHTEAIYMWLQPHGVIMTIIAPGFEEIVITDTDLAGPISFGSNDHDSTHLLCLYAVHSDEPTDAERAAAQWTRSIGIDNRCLRLGSFAVVIPAQPFLDRIKDALPKQGYQARGKLVKYYDEANFHGEIPAHEVPFMKQNRFSYQQEFRLCIYPKVQTERPIIVDVGSLSAICQKMKSSDLKDHWLEFRASAAINDNAD